MIHFLIANIKKHGNRTKYLDHMEQQLRGDGPFLCEHRIARHYLPQIIDGHLYIMFPGRPEGERERVLWVTKADQPVSDDLCDISEGPPHSIFFLRRYARALASDFLQQPLAPHAKDRFKTHVEHFLAYPSFY